MAGSGRGRSGCVTWEVVRALTSSFPETFVGRVKEERAKLFACAGQVEEIARMEVAEYLNITS